MLDNALSGAVQSVATIPAVLTALETCDLLKISRVTLWNYTRSGAIRPMRIGKKGCGVRFSGEEIARFIKDGTESE